MQLMPETAKRYGVRDVFDPEDNIRGGVAYLADLLGDVLTTTSRARSPRTTPARARCASTAASRRTKRR
jgi:soluble lytic murein transglycosylase-like protein